MKSGKGRRIAAMSIAVGLLITGIAAWAMRNAILVEWNLRRLETADDETRHQAVRALGGLQSPRGRVLRSLSPKDEPTQYRSRNCLSKVRR